MGDLVNRSNTAIARIYTSWSVKIKLGFGMSPANSASCPSSVPSLCTALLFPIVVMGSL